MIGCGSAADPFLQPDALFSYRNTDAKSIRSPRLNAGESTAVIVLVGQSNICNTGDTAFTPVNAAKIDNFNWIDGGTYSGADPLLGCSLTSGLPGNVGTRLADKLITAGIFQRVILAPIGVSGTRISRWASGGDLNSRLTNVYLRLAAVGLSPTIWKLSQGESDNGLVTQAAYAAWVASVIATPRAIGDNAPWFIDKCTYINGVVDPLIQAAQAGIVNGTNIFAGANTDTLTGTAVNRQVVDNTHFKAAGADAAATLGVTAIDAVF
jgi:hypothetical protein